MNGYYDVLKKCHLKSHWYHGTIIMFCWCFTVKEKLKIKNNKNLNYNEDSNGCMLGGNGKFPFLMHNPRSYSSLTKYCRWHNWEEWEI